VNKLYYRVSLAGEVYSVRAFGKLAMQDYNTSGYTFVIHTDYGMHLLDYFDRLKVIQGQRS
jgi:hypothetical protein